MKNIILIGGGGNALVILSTIIDINKKKKIYNVVGFLDDNKKTKLKKIKYLGVLSKKNVDLLLKKEDIFFVWTLISTNLRKQEIRKLLQLKIPLKNFTSFAHPTAIVSEMASIGKGVTIHPLVNIGPNVKIGNHVHIFAQSMIGHDTKLGDYCYVANNASIGAKVHAKEGVYFGANSSVIEKLKIFSWSIIGLGSVLLKNVNSKKIMVGNPARELIKN